MSEMKRGFDTKLGIKMSTLDATIKKNSNAASANESTTVFTWGCSFIKRECINWVMDTRQTYMSKNPMAQAAPIAIRMVIGFINRSAFSLQL